MYKLHGANARGFRLARASSTLSSFARSPIPHLYGTRFIKSAARLSSTRNVQDSTTVLSMSFAQFFFFFFRNTRDIWHCTCLGGEKNRVVIRYATFRAPTLVRLHWLDPLCEAPHTEIYIYVYIYMKLLHATSMRGKKKEGDKLTCALGVAVWLARRS